MDLRREVNEHPASTQGSKELSELWMSMQKELPQESLTDEDEREGEKLVDINLL